MGHLIERTGRGLLLYNARKSQALGLKKAGEIVKVHPGHLARIERSPKISDRVFNKVAIAYRAAGVEVPEITIDQPAQAEETEPIADTTP